MSSDIVGSPAIRRTQLLATADMTMANVAQVAFPYGVIDGYPA